MDKALLYNKKWKKAQRLTIAFWNIWVREYLPTLQTRDKWLNVHKNLHLWEIACYTWCDLRFSDNSDDVHITH